MEKVENREKWQKLAMFCAVAGLIVNLLMVSIKGVPLSIPLGIFAIAFATLSREGTEKLPSKSKTAIILAIIALIFGALLFYITMVTTRAMADPVMSRKILETIDSIKDQLPPEMQEMFKQAGLLQ